MALPLPSVLAAMPALEARVLPDLPRDVEVVTLVEDVGSAAPLQPGALAVLTAGAAEAAGGYQLDVLVRRAAEREAAALVVRRTTRPSPTAHLLANRGGVAILELPDGVDSAGALTTLATIVAGDAAEALRRLGIAARWMLASEGPDVTPPEAVRAVAELCALDLRYEDADDAAASVAIEADGLAAQVGLPDERDASLVAALLAAVAAGRAHARHDRAHLSAVRSTTGVLGQILLVAPARLAEAAERARHLGVPIDSWHTVARLAVENATEIVGSSPVALHDLDEEILSVAVGRPSRAVWTGTHADDSLVLVSSTRAEPRRNDIAAVRDHVALVMETLASRHPGIELRAGIGLAHEGAAGLRISAVEARTALASAQLDGGVGDIALFDAGGVRRMLTEWLVTDTARGAVTDLLAPLDELGPERSRVAVRTLHAYLDESGSWQRAAARLNIHRNGVVYRIGQIGERLGVDLQDPDQRFAYQLACRARLLTTGEL